MKEEIKNLEWLQKQLDQVDCKWLKCSDCKYGYWKQHWTSRLLMAGLVVTNTLGVILTASSGNWVGAIPPAAVVLFIVVANAVWLNSPARWEWCENKVLRLGKTAQRIQMWESRGVEENVAWYKSLSNGVPVMKREQNHDGTCMYYKRKWWKFWAPR